MHIPQFSILYVNDPLHSARFYRELFQHTPVEECPSFAMFVFDSGAKFALWARDQVEPRVAQEAGAMELAFPLPDDASVEANFAKWLADGLTTVQAPTRMEFGYICMALDPDGHRLRLYCPAPELA